VGLAFTVVMNMLLLPRWGYYGAAWARLIAEAAMVGVSYYLNRRYFPTPYNVPRMVEYVVLALALYFASEWTLSLMGKGVIMWAINITLFGLYATYAIWREKINLPAMARSVLRRK
jgi:O-antigen/teichoic acid export membrane protein